MTPQRRTDVVRGPKGARPLADLVTPCLGPALARQGFGEADVLLHWPEIVGDALAEHCRPVKLQWRRRTPEADVETAGEPATLVVRVEGAFALMLQHMAPVVLERVNVHFGWRCVGRLQLKQGPLPLPARVRDPAATPDPAAVRRATEASAAVADPGLRAALIFLGGKVLGRDRATSAALPPSFE